MEDRQKAWSDAEEAYLHERIGKATYAAIAEELNRTVASVWQKAFKLGLAGDSYAPWTKEDMAFLRRNFQTMPLKKIAERLGKTETAVHSKAYKAGLRRPSGSRMSHERKLWSPEEDAKLRELAAEKNSSEIAEMLERTANSVYLRCRALGIRLCAGRRRSFEDAWPPERQAVLRAGAEEGKSLHLLAEDCGKSVASVLKALRRLGISRGELAQKRPYVRKKKPEKKPAPALPQGWINRKEAENVVGLGREKIQQLCRLGKLESKKDNMGRWMIRRESAERYAEESRIALEHKRMERLSKPARRKRPAQTAPKRRKPKLDISNEAQVEGMSKLDILKALAGL